MVRGAPLRVRTLNATPSTCSQESGAGRGAGGKSVLEVISEEAAKPAGHVGGGMAGVLLGAGGGGEGQQLSPRGAQDALRMGMEQVNPRLCIFLSESGNTHDHTNA